VAATASMEKRYTNTGTVKILPPLPIRPKETPIKIEAMYPSNSIILFAQQN
jgi:hypothetical protein